VAYSLQPSVRNSGTQAGLHLVEVQLTHVYGTEQIDGKGLELLCCFHQPGQDGVQINRKDPCGGPHAPPSAKPARTRTSRSTAAGWP
jgi:hypothetical protein